MRAAARSPGGGGMARDRAGGWRRHSAGLPQGQELLQAAEDAGENGGDGGVDGRGNPDTVLPPGLRIAAQAGESLAEGGGLVLHARIITNGLRENKEKFTIVGIFSKAGRVFFL